MSIRAQRGHVYRIAFEPDVVVLGLVVSSDRINGAHTDYATVQITGSKLHEDTFGAVRLRSGDPAFGHVVCRDIGMVHQSELKEDLGQLSMETQVAVDKALKTVLGL